MKVDGEVNVYKNDATMNIGMFSKSFKCARLWRSTSFENKTIPFGESSLLATAFNENLKWLKNVN